MCFPEIHAQNPLQKGSLLQPWEKRQKPPLNTVFKRLEGLRCVCKERLCLHRPSGEVWRAPSRPRPSLFCRCSALTTVLGAWPTFPDAAASIWDTVRFNLSSFRRDAADTRPPLLSRRMGIAPRGCHHARQGVKKQVWVP